MANFKQAENKVDICGLLSEVNIKEGTSKDGKEYASGEINVRVTQNVFGKTEVMDIPVSLFAMKKTKTGGENPAYAAIKKIQDEYISLAACGDEKEASYIRIDRGDLRENAFYNQSGALVSYARVNASFTNKIRRDECEPRAEFTNVVVIGGINEEIKNDAPTGRLIIKGIVPQYGGRVDVIDFIAASPESVNHINTYWNEGDTVRVHGIIRFSSTTTYTEEEVGFGEPIKKERTTYVRELLITSGSPSALDGELAYDANEIKTALSDRQARIDEQKSKSSTKAPKTTNSFGF